MFIKIFLVFCVNNKLQKKLFNTSNIPITEEKNTTGVRFSARLQLVTSCFEGGNSNLFTFFNFIHTSAGHKKIYERYKIYNMLTLLNFIIIFFIFTLAMEALIQLLRILSLNLFFVNNIYCPSLTPNSEFLLMDLITACARVIFYFLSHF